MPKRVSLALGPGRFVALRGRFGSGTTRLLNCIGSLDRPTVGSVRRQRRDLGRKSEPKRVRISRDVGFVSQLAVRLRDGRLVSCETTVALT